MAWVLGETVQESFEVAGATGQTFTRTASYINGSATTFNPTFTEIGGGFYRYAYTPAVAGSFEWTGTATNGDGVTINFDVEATGVTIVISSAATGGLTQTRAQLRRLVAKRFGDHTALVATANGTTTTILDTYHVNDGTHHFNGCDIICLNGTNANLRRRVKATATSTGTLTLNSALTAATATSDTFDCFNRAARGYTAEQYDDAINAAIIDAYPAGMIHVVATVGTAFDAETPEVTVPAALVDVTDVELQDSDGDWHIVPKARARGGDGWWADKAAGQLRLHGRAAWMADELTLRMHGLGRQDTLSTDSDVCALNVEYIVAHAAYHLALGYVGNDDMAVRVNDLRSQYNAARSRMRTYRPPHAARVRAA